MLSVCEFAQCEMLISNIFHNTNNKDCYDLYMKCNVVTIYFVSNFLVIDEFRMSKSRSLNYRPIWKYANENFIQFK